MLDLRSLATRAKNDLAPGGCMFTMSSLPLSQPIDREQGALPSAEAMRYDGYSCFITTLSSSPISLVRKALYRQKSEEQFLLALNGLESAPDFPEDAEGMRGHFLLSYITLIVHCRIRERLSAADVLLSDDLLMDTLRSMNLVKLSGEGYIPAYTRTPLTDALHRAFGFRTDCEILTSRQLRTLFKEDPLP